MQIIYVNRGTSPSRFEEYLKKYNNKLQQQGQKYNQLLMEGLVKNNVDVLSLSTRPINRAITQQKFFKGEQESENGIEYFYIPFLNVKFLRELSVFWGVFLNVLFSKGNKKETVIICDSLNIAASFGALPAAFIRGYKTVGIVTDVPGHLSYADHVSLNQRINLFIMQRFKSYLLLTEPMSRVVNSKNRPYVILEGHADLSMQAVENRLVEKDDKIVCLYAGSLMKKYGIENLVKGFVKVDIPNSELHIYGMGDYGEELINLSEKYNNVKYMGVAPNSEIVKAEIRATLLINPRPVGEDYTKYSFPSKNMEYMASGTPVLTTKLPGMPVDHLPYVYIIDDESSDGIAKILREVLSKSRAELHKKGNGAKEFVMREKNNIKQAKKLLDMIEMM